MFRLCQLVFWLLLPVGANATCLCSASGATEDQALNNYYSNCQTNHKECLSLEDGFVCSNLTQSEQSTQQGASRCGVTVQQQFSGALIENSIGSSVTSPFRGNSEESTIRAREGDESVFSGADSSLTRARERITTSLGVNSTKDDLESISERGVGKSRENPSGISFSGRLSRGQFSACCFNLDLQGPKIRRICLVLKGEYNLTQPGMVCRPL